MHKLDRDSVSIPDCLRESGRRYCDLCGSEKQIVRSALLEMQGQRCAYCERRTGNAVNDGHIEHFRNQADHSQLQCEWTNLFWSCNDENTCGRHKDKCRKQAGPYKCFSPDDIIDPAREDPEVFLLFVSDGTVRARDEMCDRDRYRAEETLRVFQIGESPLLRKSREDAVKPYIRGIDMLVSNSPSLVPLYIQSVMGDLATTPFSTAIKSFLRSVTEE